MTGQLTYESSSYSIFSEVGSRDNVAPFHSIECDQTSASLFTRKPSPMSLLWLYLSV